MLHQNKLQEVRVEQISLIYNSNDNKHEYEANAEAPQFVLTVRKNSQYINSHDSLEIQGFLYNHITAANFIYIYIHIYNLRLCGTFAWDHVHLIDRCFSLLHSSGSANSGILAPRWVSSKNLSPKNYMQKPNNDTTDSTALLINLLYMCRL